LYSIRLHRLVVDLSDLRRGDWCDLEAVRNFHLFNKWVLVLPD